MSDAAMELDEAADYLRRYRDVALAVASGRFASAFEHYENYGKFEGRQWGIIRDEAPPPPPEPEPATVPLVGACDAVIWSENGFFLEGWVDDRLQPAETVELVHMGSGRRTAVPVRRYRRLDVEAHLGAPHPNEFGLWAAGTLPLRGRTDGLEITLTYRDGTASRLEPGAQLRLSHREYFEHLLSHYGRRALLGNLTARSFAELDGGLGDLITGLYDQMRETRVATSTATFGGTGTKPKLSLICVLYGIPDFLYVFVSQFARYAALEDIEFVFASNSPELEDVLMRDAEVASFVFNTTVKLVSLNQNCGFSYANNIAIAGAAADTIVVINPDVFPVNAESVQALARYAGTELGRDVVGGKLYYADGSVMHDGMYFEPERKLTALCRVPVWTVEHFRKGFADRPEKRPKPVPAVSGALMVFGKRCFAELGGFDESFVYGHYEDADLCLRAREAGGKVLLDPALTYWHYEGKGSVKRPEHAGSGLYNRWLFSRRWGHKLQDANNV